MRSRGSKPALFLVATVVALAIVALVWAMSAGSSEALPDTMHNCPQAGNWAISVWDGADGTDTAQALDTCGAGAVTAAYSLDPQTQLWLRWFAGRADVSNLKTLNRMQGVIAFGAVGAPPPTATATPAPTETPAPPPVEPIAGATYTGITSQGLSMELTVADDGAHIPRWQVEFLWSDCEGGSTWGIESPVGTPIERNAFVDFGQDDVRRSSYDFSGVFQSSEFVVGEARFTDEIGGTPCDSGTIEWNATAQEP